MGDEAEGVSKEVRAAVVKQLEGMGIVVHRFTEAEEGSEQESVKPYGKEKPYKNREKASKKEIAAIKKKIEEKRYNKAGTDAVKVGEKIFVIDHSTDEEYNENAKDGDGFGIRSVYKAKDVKEEQIREIIRRVRADYRDSAVRIRRLLYDLGIGRGYVSGVDIVAELERGIGSDVMGDGEGGRARGEMGDDGSVPSGGADKRGIRASGEAIETSDGRVVLGYVKDGEIHLHEGALDADTPLHEYTHLWDEAVAHANPELWARGVELMKQIVRDMYPLPEAAQIPQVYIHK